MNVLFICGRNRIHSPAAEAPFLGRNGIVTAYAGRSADAEKPHPLQPFATTLKCIDERHAAAVHAIMEAAIDEVVIRGIPVADSEVVEQCADPPAYGEQN